jgi:hypothetical protein
MDDRRNGDYSLDCPVHGASARYSSQTIIPQFKEFQNLTTGENSHNATASVVLPTVLSSVSLLDSAIADRTLTQASSFPFEIVIFMETLASGLHVRIIVLTFLRQTIAWYWYSWALLNPVQFGTF